MWGATERGSTSNHTRNEQQRGAQNGQGQGVAEVAQHDEENGPAVSMEQKTEEKAKTLDGLIASCTVEGEDTAEDKDVDVSLTSKDTYK